VEIDVPRRVARDGHPLARDGPLEAHRAGITYIIGLRFGLVVIGTISPPSTICG